MSEQKQPAVAGQVERPARPLSDADWRFVWQVLEGTKLDTPRIRANVEQLLAMAEEFEALDLKNHALAREAHTWWTAARDALKPREPLNFDQLQRVMSQHFGGRELTDDEADSAEAFARAVERAHGIGA